MLDALLAPALIRGAGPVPALGMAGSAVALLVSQAAALATLLAWMRASHHVLCLVRRARPPAPASRPPHRGGPVANGPAHGAANGGGGGQPVVLLTIVNRQGALATAAYSAAQPMWTYVQMPALAIGAACTSMAAQCMGARNWCRIGCIARAGVVWALLATGAWSALVLLLDAPLLALFLPAGGPEMVAARDINHQVIASFMPLGAGIVLSGVARSTGAVWTPLALLAFAL